MSVLFSNNASTTLSAGVGNSATSITVADGSVFPSISGSDYFYVTLEVDSDSDLKEIVKVTARSGNTLTITRGEDGTSARTFSSGDKCELRLNAAALNDAVLGGNTTEMSLNQFTGDGSTTAFTLSSSPNENLTNVFLSGVYQSKSNYSISGNTLTFTTAPPNGLAIEVMVAEVVEFAVGVVADDSVTSDKLSNALSTKIAGIEASADVTDTANVTAAGALMDSEVTNLAQVKAFDSSDYATAAQGTNADTAHGWGDHGAAGYLTSHQSLSAYAPLASPTFTGTATMDGLTVDTDTLYVNSTNNRVGIGTTSPSRQLEIYDDGTNGQAVLALTAQNTENSRIMFADPDDNNIGILDYSHADDSMRFTVNNQERARLTSNGHLLVGKDTGDPAVAGSVLYSYGRAAHTVDASTVQILNRKTNDGTILLFEKNMADVGRVSTLGNDLIVGSSKSSGAAFRMDGTNNQIYPSNSAGNARDDAVSLGASTARFKDLYLSGTITSNQPAFDARSNSSSMKVTSGVVPYSIATVNIGSGYSTSTYRFTAPVAGQYLISWYGLLGDTNTNGTVSQSHLYIRKNGSQIVNCHSNNNDYWEHASCTTVVSLAVNDYVDVYLYSGGIYYGDSNNHYSRFCGYLIG